MSRIKKSRAYRKAQSLVSATMASPAKLLALANSAQKKATNRAQSRISDLIEPIKTSYRLIKAYARGVYHDVSLENLGLIVAAMIYFVMPIDALPDFIAGLGLADDATLLAWTFSKVKEELDRFTDWEAQIEKNDVSNSKDSDKDIDSLWSIKNSFLHFSDSIADYEITKLLLYRVILPNSLSKLRKNFNRQMIENCLLTINIQRNNGQILLICNDSLHLKSLYALFFFTLLGLPTT